MTRKDRANHPAVSLARGAGPRPRGRRAEALLEEPDAAQLIPQIPVQNLYYAIKEVGLADAYDVVALATPEQVRGFLDLDVWDRDLWKSRA